MLNRRQVFQGTGGVALSSALSQTLIGGDKEIKPLPLIKLGKTGN